MCFSRYRRDLLRLTVLLWTLSCQLPWNARNLAKLEVLNCSANVIEYLPREVGSMTNLRKLNLYNNNLRALPAELGNLVDNLEEFDALRNPLSGASW